MTKKLIKEVLVRMPLNLHAATMQLAREKGMSLNKLINEVMADYSGETLNSDVIDEFRQRFEAIEKNVAELKKEITEKQPDK